MEYAQLQSFVFVLMSICGGVVSVAAAVAIVVKFWKWAHAGSDKNSEDIEALKGSYEEAKQEYLTWFASDKRRIETLEKNQEDFKEQNKLMLRALNTLLMHEIDGNHLDSLKSMRDEIGDYLVNKLGG